MPRYVVDNNALVSEELRLFLAEADDNFAVLSDELFLEAIKPKEVENSAARFQVLRQYTTQVLILWPTGRIAQLCTEVGDLQDKLIDWEASKRFPSFIERMERAVARDSTWFNIFADEADRNQAELQAIKAIWQDIKQRFVDAQKKLTPTELAVIRSDSEDADWILRLPRSLIEKIDFYIDSMIHGALQKHSDIVPRPLRGEETTSFLYRRSLIHIIQWLQWISTGSSTTRKQNKFENDVIDSSYATVATYFDGLITNDRNCRARYSSAKLILTGLAKLSGSNSQAVQ